MIAANIIAAVITSIWIMMLRVGFSIVQGVVDQHVAGYPSRGEVIFWIGMPSMMLIAILLTAIFANAIRRSPALLGFVSVGTLLPFPLYIFSGGGV